MNSGTLICLWILVIPIGIIEVSTKHKCCFWLYFSSLQDYWPPCTWIALVHISWGEMERFEKRAFQLLKMRKKIIWYQYFYLGIWNDDRTKMIVLHSFQLATRLNSQNTNETEIINEFWHINLFMNIGISNWHNWSFDLR